MDSGRNAGVTGLVDITGTPKFTAHIYQWQQHLEAEERDRSGRGDDAWGDLLAYRTGGNLIVSGKVRIDGYPLPDKFKGQTGSIQIQLNTGVTDTVQVKVLAADLSLDEKTAGVWNISFTCRITDDPALAGFTGTQPTADTPAAGDKETWEGLSKTIDPQSLADGATQRFDIEGLTDSDAAEVTKIGNLIAAAQTPVNGLKLRPAGFVRLGPTAGVITLQWSRTSTADDVTMPQTRTTVDPSGLASEATSAAINGTPTTPTGDSFVKTASTTSQLHDTATLTVDSYGLRSTHDAVEMDGTSTTADPSGLADSATATKETTSATPPTAPTLTGYVYRTVTTQQLNPGHWKHLFSYGLRTTQEDIEQDESNQSDDPADIADEATITQVTASGTAPATPTAPLGTKHTFTRSRQVNENKWAHTFEYRRRDSQDDIEMPGTHTRIDPSDLESDGRQTLVYNTGDDAPAATVPTGLQAVGTTTQAIHDGKQQVVYDFAKDTPQQRIEQENTFTATDPDGLASEAKAAALDGTPALPDGFVERQTTAKAVTHDHTLNTTSGGLRSTTDDVEMPGNYIDTDPADLRTTGRKTTVYATDTPPTDPTPPDGLKITGSQSKELNRLKSVKEWTYGKNTSKDEVEQDGTVTRTDPQGLASEARVTTVDASPSLPAGFVERSSSSRQLTPDHAANTVEGGLRSTTDDIEMPGTVTRVDPLGIDSNGRKATVYTTADGAPTDPTPPGGLQISASESEQLNQTKSVKRWLFDVLTSEQKIEFQHQRDTTDPQDLNSGSFKADVFVVGSPPTTPAAPTGEKLVDYMDVPVTPTKSVRVWRYGKNDSADDLIHRNTFTETDPQGLASRAAAAALDATPATPAGFVERTTRTQAVTPDHNLTVVEAGLTTTAQDQEYAHQRTTTDPAALENETIEAQVFTNAAPPADPTVTGLKLDRKWDVPLTPDQSLRVWEFRPTTSADRRTLPDTWESLDPKGLESRARAAAINDTPALPAGYKERATRSVKLDDNNTLAVIDGGLTDAQDDIELPGTFTVTDPAGLEGHGRKTTVYATDTPPDDPTPPTGQKITSSTVKVLNGAKSAKVWEFGTATSQDRMEWGQSVTRVDPVALDGDQSIAQVQDSATPTAPALPTGMKLVDTITRQQTDGKWLHKFNYGLMDRQDAAAIEQARAEYSSVNRGGYATAQVVDYSGDVQPLALSWHDTLRANVDYEAVDVRRLNLNKAIVISRYRQPSILVTAESGITYTRPMHVRLNGSTFEVFVVAAGTRGTAAKWARITATPQVVKTLRFYITRRFLGTTLPMHEDLLDTVSNAAFLGLSASKVTYIGAETRTNLADAAPQVSEIRYGFFYQNTGFFDISGVPTGVLPLDAAQTITSADRGWVDIAKTGLTATQMTGGDYSVFLS